MGPSVRVCGLMALRPVLVGVVVGVTEGVVVALAVAVAVAPGVAVCCPASETVNVTEALRGLSASVAWIVCCPVPQLCSTVKDALNVPSPLTLIVVVLVA